MPKRSEFKGKMIEVDIYEAGKHFLKGRPAEGSEPFTPSIAAPLQKGEVSGLMQVKMSTGARLCHQKTQSGMGRLSEDPVVLPHPL